ncbi:MAG: hypothetical protein IJH68_03065 [Thermoguttaceae bacterium]|nr:hypothetical protein [Thermoguttaceae bacterium]
MKFNKHVILGVEKSLGLQHFCEYFHLNESDLDHYNHSSSVYFKKYGFKVADFYSEFYSRFNGIVSDKYISTELYYFYIIAYLNNGKYTNAYVDKAAYDRIFFDVDRPRTILKCQNNIFYDENGNAIDYEKSLDLIRHTSDFIIKPSLSPTLEGGSGCGNNVHKFNGDDFKTKESVRTLFSEYSNAGGANFVVQSILEQHPITAQFNASSLNTIRVYTYRRLNKEIVVLGSLIRFGSNDSVVDNACAGGGFCRIMDDGTVCDQISQASHFKKGSLKQRGIQCKIPQFRGVLDWVKCLHSKIAWFDLCGWDVAISSSGKPTLIELNEYPDCEFIQAGIGPMFGEYTDEVMEQISNSTTEYALSARRTFSSGRSSDIFLKEFPMQE